MSHLPERKVCTRPKLRVLYVETGETGTGGSFRSLFCQVQAALASGRVDPVVVLLNDSWCLDAIRSLGVPCERETGHLFDRDRQGRLLPRILFRIARVLDRLPWSLPATVYDHLIHRRLIRRMISMIRKRRIDIVHLNTQVHRDHFGSLSAKTCRVPVVQHLRSYYPVPGSARIRSANRHVSRYLPVSEGTRNHWIELGVDGAKMTLLPNAIPEEPPAPLDLEAEWGIPADHRVIGSVGRMTERRHCDWLLYAFERIHQQEPATSLFLVGDGFRKREFEDLSSRLGLQPWVRLPGYDPRGREIIAQLHVSVLCLDVEPTGRALLESWMAGTPVVAARIEPLGVAVDGGNILLYEPGDSEDLARQILRLLRDESLRDRIVEGARKTCGEHFGMGLFAERLLRVYEEIAARTSE